MEKLIEKKEFTLEEKALVEVLWIVNLVCAIGMVGLFVLDLLGVTPPFITPIAGFVALATLNWFSRYACKRGLDVTKVLGVPSFQAMLWLIVATVIWFCLWKIGVAPIFMGVVGAVLYVCFGCVGFAACVSAFVLGLAVRSVIRKREKEMEPNQIPKSMKMAWEKLEKSVLMFSERLREGLKEAKEEGTVIKFIEMVRAERANALFDKLSSPDKLTVDAFTWLNEVYELLEQQIMEEILSPEEIQAVNEQLKKTD